MIKRKQINHNPIKSYVAAISCGIVNGELLMDLNYEEDSKADIDSNYVMNDKGHTYRTSINSKISNPA